MADGAYRETTHCWHGRYTSLMTNNPSQFRPSLEVLNALHQYDDFMASIRTLIDLGCGSGEDLLWWGTAATRDDSPIPLNIKCVGMDKLERLDCVKPYPNISYRQGNFESIDKTSNEEFDVLWCFDSFQYCIDPLNTLKRWWNIASAGAMLCISVPQTTGYQRRQTQIYQHSGQYYHHTLVSMIHMLAVTGWNCKSGFFLKRPENNWIHAVVYKHDAGAFDLDQVNWYTLMEAGRLPDSADTGILAHGYLRQQDLILPWVDRSLHVLAKQ